MFRSMVVLIVLALYAKRDRRHDGSYKMPRRETAAVCYARDPLRGDPHLSPGTTRVSISGVVPAQ